MLKQAKQASYFICFKTMFHMFHAFVAKLKLVMLHQQVWHVSTYGKHMLHLRVAQTTFHNQETMNNTHSHVAYSCFKQNKCINKMNDAHAYEKQVQNVEAKHLGCYNLHSWIHCHGHGNLRSGWLRGTMIIRGHHLPQSHLTDRAFRILRLNMHSRTSGLRRSRPGVGEGEGEDLQDDGQLQQ
jgi:hypothetical protein